MIICHVCNAECDDSLELCPVCGAELKKASENEETENNIIENPTMLYSFEDIVSAEIFKDILKDNNIHYTCSSEMGDNSIQVVFGGGFCAEDVYVSENDLDKANQLLEDFQNSQMDFEEEFFDDTDFEEEN